MMKHRRYTTCWRKRRYESEKEALDVVKKRLEEGGVFGLSVYHCEFCGCWHIGHRKERDWYSKVEDNPKKNFEERTQVYVGKHKVPYDKLRK